MKILYDVRIKSGFYTQTFRFDDGNMALRFAESMIEHHVQDIDSLGSEKEFEVAIVLIKEEEDNF